MIIIEHKQDPGFKFCAFDVPAGWHIQLVDGIELVHEEVYRTAYEARGLAAVYGFDVIEFTAYAIGLANCNLK